jgi:CBS domain-containing protein
MAEPTSNATRQPSDRSPALATVADVMRPSPATVEQDSHLAAAAYLMKHAGTTALAVVDRYTDRPVGILTEAHVTHAVADGLDVNEVRVHDLMTARPTVVDTATTIRAAAGLMTSGRFRQLPVVDDTGLVGMVDISDVCRALIECEPPGTGVASAG